MISQEDYFGTFLHHSDATEWRQANARVMLLAVNNLLDEAHAHGVDVPINPITGTQVSGQTLGGFRPQSAAQGAPHSAHKEARAVDVYDPHEALERWITDDILEAFGLYREAPTSTKGWVHLTDRAPGSGRRTFQP